MINKKGDKIANNYSKSIIFIQDLYNIRDRLIQMSINRIENKKRYGSNAYKRNHTAYKKKQQDWEWGQQKRSYEEQDDDFQHSQGQKQEEEFYRQYMRQFYDDSQDDFNYDEQQDLDDYIEYVTEPYYDEDDDDPGWRYNEQWLRDEIFQLKREMNAIQSNKKKLTDFLFKHQTNYYQRSNVMSISSATMKICLNPHFLLEALTKEKVIGYKSFVLEVAYVQLGGTTSQDASLLRSFKEQALSRSKGQDQINFSSAIDKCIDKNKIQGYLPRKINKTIVQPQQILNDFKNMLFNRQKTQIKGVLLMLMNVFHGKKSKIETINDFKKRSLEGNVTNLHIYIRYKAEDQIKTVCIDCKALDENLRQQQLWAKGSYQDRELIKRKHRQRKTYVVKKKKQQNEYKFKQLPRQVQKKYIIHNLNFGITQNGTAQQFFSYFDYKTLQSHANLIENSFKHLLMIRKAGDDYKIEFTSFLFNRTAIKIEIQFFHIEKVEFYSTAKKIYIHLKSPPKFFVHLMQKNLAFDQFSIEQWHRVQNFPIVRNSYFQHNNYILWKKARSNTVLQLQLNNHEDIYNLKEVFRRFTDIIYLNDINRSKVQSIALLLKPYHKLWQKFIKAITKVPIAYSVTIYHIKYQLLCLFQRGFATFLQIIEVLEQIQLIIDDRQYDQLQYFSDVILKISRTKLDMRNHIIKKQQKKLVQIIVQKMEKLKKQATQQNHKEQTKDKDYAILANLKITPSGLIISEYTHQMKNRVLKHFHGKQHQFLKIEVFDDNYKNLFAVDHLTNTYIRQLLDNVIIFGKKYYPLTWSQSQLKSNSMWFLRQKIYEDDIQVEQIQKFLGQFSHIKNPALKAARMGQGFSNSYSYDGSMLQVTTVQDIKDHTGKYIFSDGIGMIAQNIVQKFAAKMGLNNISILQIRYLGGKGLVVVNPDLKPNQIYLRQSMVKYNCQHPDAKKYLDIVGWNNYKVGFINRQIILLLKSCNLKEENLIELQNIYLKEILQVFKEKNHLLNFIRSHFSEGFLNVKKNILSVYKYLLAPNQSFDVENEPFLRGIIKTLQAQALKTLKLKARIKVQKSARIYGILDQFGVLEQQQVYCSVIKPDINNKQQDLQKRYNISGKVVLTRNPCMHPSDIQIVTCVSDQKIKQRFEKIGKSKNYFKKYSNCVIFPQKGKIPLTAKISGSDLDGDEFFICWDENLRPKFQNKDQFIADNLEKNPNFTDQCGSRQMLNFFVQYINNQKLGRLSNSHLIHADRYGVHCQQCQKLNYFHTLAVDYPKKGYKFQIPRNLFISQYPHYLEKPYPYRSYYSKSILGKLYDEIDKISLKQPIQLTSYLHINKIELNYTKNQYDEAEQILKKYEQKINIARQYYKIKTEFELFCGSQNERNEHKSIIMLSKIEQQFQNQFVKLQANTQFKKIKQLQAKKFLRAVSIQGFSLKKKQKIKQFNNILNKWKLNDQHIRKALLWYIVSAVNPTFEKMEQTKKNVFKIQHNRQRCGYGLVWLCIPNVMLWLYKQGYFDLKKTDLRI